ncbi:MAG: hypothetical protein HY674_03910 [Chloroflexi bacterium]|nr:hypothetical protein [Chloroflexota bacterium]
MKKRFLEERECHRLHCDSDTWDVLLYEMVRLKGRRLIYDDPCSQWEGGFCFAVFLAPDVEAGDLRFVREDGIRWGYHVDGQGNVFALTWTEEMLKEPIIRANSDPLISCNPRTFRRMDAKQSLSGKA